MLFRSVLKLSGTLGHCGEGIGGEERSENGASEKFFLRRSILPTPRSYADSSSWTPPAAPLPEESANGREVGTMERRRNRMDPK